jgi:formylglycine-generating enzyme required for sulfatase activity
VLVGLGVFRYWPFGHAEETAGARPTPHPDQPAQTAMPVPAPVPEVVTPPKPRPAPEPGHPPLTPNESQQLQKDWAEHLGQSVEQAGPAGVKLVLIPPGSFEMVPRYHVTITRPYLMGTTEVTRRQFKAFVAAMDYVSTSEAAALFKPLGASTTPKKENGNWREPGFTATDDAPITHVSYMDAEAFVAWLSKTDGKTYRLPTEAEWRWACRSGATTQYARYKYNSPPHPCPVGDLRPNAWGLYDMLGNVREWCADGHAAHREGNFTDPLVPIKANASRVQCGGMFLSESKYTGVNPGWGHMACDCNTRAGAYWYMTTIDCGFRICREP